METRRFATYLCDFCKETEMFGPESDWQKLDDGRDMCVDCLIKIKNEAIKIIKDIASNHDCDADAHKYNTPCFVCMCEKFLKHAR